MSCRLLYLLTSILLVLPTFGETAPSCRTVILVSKTELPVTQGHVQSAHAGTSTDTAKIIANRCAHLIIGKGRHPRLIAIGLALILGPLGGHRIYLGTKPYVPVVYAVTLGGGLGILPLCDIVAIILCKDVSVYMNNPNVVMWIRRKQPTQR